MPSHHLDFVFGVVLKVQVLLFLLSVAGSRIMSFLLTSVLASKFGTNYVVARSDDANDAARPEPPMSAAESRRSRREPVDTDLWKLRSSQIRGKMLLNYDRTISECIDPCALVTFL